jgi:cytochrome c5
MKKVVKKLAQKKYTTISVLMAILLCIIGAYTLLNLKVNLKQMADQSTEAPYNFATYPTPNTLGKDPAVIQRGEYLVKAGDCIACHTNSPEKGQAFAGGLPMHTPFGTIYSPNITPDKDTGLGKWTEADFIKAMRHGVSPEGHYYYPAFPYYYFNHVTDDDLKAIKAYLDSIPPIKQKNLPNKMMKPFDKRILQFGWRFLFFRHDDTGPTKEDPKQSAIWNRGAYLVEGLGHCAMCHSPSYHIISESISLGAPIRKYNLTGAKIQGYLAPNISKSNLASISTDEIMDVFLKDKLIGGGNVEGPMLEANHDSLSLLTHDDLLAIATYLKSVNSVAPPKPSTSGGPGAAVYEGYCSGCHTTGSGGAPKMGDKAAWDALQKKSTMDQIYSIALHGKGGMPAKGTCLSCSELDIKQAVDYMIHGGAGEAAVLPPSSEVPLTQVDGKRIYDNNCSVCHNDSVNGAPKPGDIKAWEPIVNTGFYDTLINIKVGRHGHPRHGGCKECSDADLKAALKYMMKQSAPTHNYDLW